MSKSADEVLIVGASTRGLTESAALAGFRVHAVDAYGDLDLRERAATVTLPREPGQPWKPGAAARAAASIRAPTVAYVSNLENHPSAVARVAAGRHLWGNSAEVLRRVRDPLEVAAALRRRGFSVPLSVTTNELADDHRTWLLKPRRSGGGHGIRRWCRGERVPRTKYLQEQVDGVPGSITFVADGRRAVPLGLSLQLVGEPLLGGAGFRYCGSLLCGGAPLFEHEATLAANAADLASAVTECFGLIGVNGIDFMARDGTAWLLEVNPRYCASMELIERAHGVSIFGLHADGCSRRLPTEAPFGQRLAGVTGKAIVYARESVVVEPGPWCPDSGIRDVPHPDERIRRGRPICTVFAQGESANACLAALAERAAWVYALPTRADRGAA